MYKFIAFFLLVATLSVSACKEDEAPKTQFTLAFDATYDGDRLEVLKDYTYNNFPLEFSRLNFFLSDIVLVKANGEEELLSEIEFIDFTPDNATSPITKPINLSFSVPDGDYTAVKMGFGVKPSLNAKKPSDFTPGHPLFSAQAEFWDSWKSYIFMKVEGNGYTTGGNVPDLFLRYHCGSDAVYRTVSFPVNLSMEGTATTKNINFDLRKLFTFNGKWYDVKVKNATSDNPSDVIVATELMDNVQNAVSIQ